MDLLKSNLSDIFEGLFGFYYPENKNESEVSSFIIGIVRITVTLLNNK